MKRLLPALCALALLATFGPIPSANAWWWHHSKSNSKNAEPAAKPPKHAKKSKQPKASKDNSASQSGGPLYTIPKSVGWWHKGPGPAGAGS